eukprot:gene12093-5586_t
MLDDEKYPEQLYSPLREVFIKDELKENDFYVKAKRNLESSKRWAYVIGFISFCMMFFGIFMNLLRYAFLYYGVEEGHLMKWILGFIEGFLIVFVSFFGIFSCLTQKLPKLRQCFSIAFGCGVCGILIFGTVVSGFGVLLWGFPHPKHGTFAIIEIIASIAIHIVLWGMILILSIFQTRIICVESK